MAKCQWDRPSGVFLKSVSRMSVDTEYTDDTPWMWLYVSTVPSDEYPV